MSEAEYVLVRWGKEGSAKALDEPMICIASVWESWSAQPHNKDSWWEEIARGTEAEMHGFRKLLKESEHE